MQYIDFLPMDHFSTMFRISMIFAAVMFALVFGFFIYVAVRAFRTKKKNDASPRLTVDAKIVTKRMDVSTHNRPVSGDATGAHGYHSTTSTTYYATFQVESGDRIELEVPRNEYGLLVEGDTGRLTFQGTRYLGFARGTARDAL